MLRSKLAQPTDSTPYGFGHDHPAGQLVPTARQLSLADWQHDLYFTTNQQVGTQAARAAHVAAGYSLGAPVHTDGR